MKTTARPRLALALATSVLAVGAARSAHATVVWTAGFEKNKSGDPCGSGAPGVEFNVGSMVEFNGRLEAEVLGERVYSGNLACKLTVHPDDIYGQYYQDRIDVRHNSTLTGEGKDMYLSGHYYLAADAQTRDEFGMFETTNSLNWFDIWFEPKTGGGTTINLGIESNGANLGSVHIWSGDFTPGHWHQIAIHFHWSQDATKGLVDFWLDGQQVVTGYKHKTKPNANDLYFLTGLHRVLTQPYTETIYFDDFIEADAQSDIKIGAPTDGTPDGGATGGSDGGGTAGNGGSTGAGGAAASGGTTGDGGSTTTGGTTGSAAGSTGSSGGATGSTGGSAGSSVGEGGATAAGGAAGGGGSSGTRSGGGSGCAISGSSGPERPLWFSAASLIALALRARRAKRRVLRGQRSTHTS
ncbi:MAG TPA: heparin lyase I family protein [Polyangia bacterium]|nr:heparin lyase I family protein [Polyangia bacterium]